MPSGQSKGSARCLVKCGSLCFHHASSFCAENYCGMCEISFSTKKASLAHASAKHPKFKCALCDQGFRTKNDQSQHDKDKHPRTTQLSDLAAVTYALVLQGKSNALFVRVNCLSRCSTSTWRVRTVITTTLHMYVLFAHSEPCMQRVFAKFRNQAETRGASSLARLLPCNGCVLWRSLGGPDELQCGECSVSFGTKKHLNSHMAQHGTEHVEFDRSHLHGCRSAAMHLVWCCLRKGTACAAPDAMQEVAR